MYSKNKQFFKGLFFGITFISLVLLANSAPASEQTDTGNYENLDARWFPWIGSWQLLSNKVNTKESSSEKEYLLTITPGSSENSIIMKGYRGDEILVEEEMIADGLRHPLKDKKCSGYYMYSWSETGKRLLLESESNCPGDPQSRISGMSIIDDNRDWLDIQLLQKGTDKNVSIRKYRNIDSDDSVISGRFNPGQISISRIAAGKNFSISEIIELSSKVEPEVLEVALLEIRKPFPINSKQLVNLSDSGVNSRVIDLMVAFSFPDKFTVEQETISLARANEMTGQMSRYNDFRNIYLYYPYDYPFLPWHWTSYYPYWSYGYGYSYLGWYLMDGSYYYPLWTYPPIYYYGGGGEPVRDGGTMIKGRGYTRIDSGNSGSSSRRARPRIAPSMRSAPVRSSSSSSSGGGSSSGYSDSGGVSTGTVGGYSGGSPSVSPNGYSSGH